MWKWTWLDPQSDSESDTSFAYSDANANFSSQELDSTSDEPMSEEEIPPITHSVVFKSIGCHKELRYQELLSLAKKRINDGLIVPVKLQSEPDNSFDNKAIAIMCQINQDKWERFGYIVKEALDDVHEAINNHKILSVSFAWIKYIVYFKCPGWYAGVKITRSGDWSDVVLRSRANDYM